MIEIPFEVIERFAMRNDISIETSIRLHQIVVEFLDKEGTNSPNPLIDEVWHEFILHTKIYKNFCIERYGKYINHNPTSMKSKGDGKILNLLNNKKYLSEVTVNEFSTINNYNDCNPDSEPSGDEDTSGTPTCDTQ